MYKQDIQYPIYLGICHYQFIISPIIYKFKSMSLKESLKGVNFSLTFKPPPPNHTAEGSILLEKAVIHDIMQH